MGELKPCPFCNCDRAYQRGFLRFECPECGAQGPAKGTKAEAITAWNTRPRTEGRGEGLNTSDERVSGSPESEHVSVEAQLAAANRLVDEYRKALEIAEADLRRMEEGRGEGEPVAWAYEYTNHLKGDRAPGGWLRAVAFEAPSRARVNAGFARNVQPLYASPIREPEISRAKRDELEKLLRENLPATCGLHCQREQTQAEEDAAYRDTARAILNLAPVGDWRPIETAPKDGTAILGAWTSLDGPTAYGVITWDGESWIENFTPVGPPNRWQPLPPPPQEQGGMK